MATKNDSSSTTSPDDDSISITRISLDLDSKPRRSEKQVSSTPIAPLCLESKTPKTSCYSRLATYMSADPEKSSAIFRRFDRVNMRNLLILENEIAELEGKLERLEEQEFDGELEWKGQDMKFDGGVDEENNDAKDRVKEIRDVDLELREKIREYYEAMLRTSDMLSLSRPSKRAIHSTYQIMQNIAMSLDAHSTPNFQHLNPKNEHDLSVLARSRESDFLTQFFETRFPSFFQDRVPGCPTPVTHHKNLAFAVTLFVTILTALFLVGAVVGLFFVESTRARLAMLCSFTVAFAATIAAATNARRQDVFVATAGYAAVLVVFVSGNLVANPAPTTCNLSNSNSNPNSAALNTALAANSASLAAITITATPAATATIIRTETIAQSIQTVISTVITHVSTLPTPSASTAPKREGLSSFAKTGIGVGAAVGVVFCCLALGCGVGPWMKKRWAKADRRARVGSGRTKERNSPAVIRWGFGKVRADGRGTKAGAETAHEVRDGRAVWV
ncbi:uncharacterized protein BDR25DRAFT_344727 [Lindgomyces ingoldianus]|uniref:Uncharacterized protein n=1 Tax=Lindgomyces ingoldianus TaxID=673940 RepID=A0ACB6QL65_9PLEO|nr:uncharacterized protein BDR25DRAFT_344727 [Lindgomyces ingoldianus]KAF2467612.1 hypothetical protein BDR25DRAFT_344727 [Lindgomyces ingoldianus]